MSQTAGPRKRGALGARLGPWSYGFLSVGLTAGVVALGYLHTLPYSFHFDDYDSIANNRALDSPTDLAAIWRFRPSRAVVYLSLALNGAVTGLSPAGLRAINLLIHLAASALIGWIAADLSRRLPPPASHAPAGRPALPRMVGLLASLIFAAHPLATQAVTYVIQRTTSLAALLELAAVATYLRARRSDRAALWGTSWAFALLAALTKEMAIALPLAIGLIELALRRVAGESRPRAAFFLPYLVVVPVIGLAAQLESSKFGHIVAGMREVRGTDPTTYLLTQLVVVPRYLGLMLWPRGQNLDPDILLRSGVDGAALAGAALLTGASGAAFLLRRRYPLPALGWAWFVVTMLPESSVFPIGDVMNEHRAYLPMAGLCWGAASVLGGLASRHRGMLAPPTLLVVALVSVTHARNRVWRDEISLWSDVVGKSPGKARGLSNLGFALRQAGRLDEAEALYRRAIAADARYVPARLNLDALLNLEGRHAEALSVLEQARAIAPDDWRVVNNLGRTWSLLGDTAAAARAYARALELAPREPLPARNLARLRGGRGSTRP